MNDSRNAFWAGLVIIAGVVVAGWFYQKTLKSNLTDQNSVQYYALITDAGGLNAKSYITVVGINVGEIQNITRVETTVADFIPDYRQRTRKILGDLPPEEVGPIDLFEHDATVKRMIAKWDLKKGADAAKIEQIGGERVTVARVDMRITKEQTVPVDSWLRKGSKGVLGANVLFLEPGNDPMLVGAGARVPNAQSVGGLDALQGQAQALLENLNSITAKVDQADIAGIADDIHSMTTELNRFILGDENRKPLNELYDMVMTDLRRTVVTIEKTVRSVNGVLGENNESINGLMANLNRITADIATMTGGPVALDKDGKPILGPDGQPMGPDGGPVTDGDIRATMAEVRKISGDLSTITGTLKEMLGDNETEIGEGVKQLRFTIAELNRSLSSLSEVTGRIERGEGTVGRLLTDEKLADKVEDAVSGASDYVASLTAIKLNVDLGSWYNVRYGQPTTTFQLKIQPRPDKFYLVELVDDGGGVERLTRTFTGVVDGVTGREEADGVVEERQVIYESDQSLRISAMFAKRFWDFLVLRAGLIESSGGVGANIFLFEDRIELRSDVFNIGGPRFTVTNDNLVPDFYLPRWRSYIKAQPIPLVYVVAGVDDVLNFYVDPAVAGYGIDYFVGAGITFQDDDLRAILPFVPSLP
jgi:phospholipid/cholesterol/gamma-HCH transport system substrate-binding protein